MSKEKFVFEWRVGDECKGPNSDNVIQVGHDGFTNSRGVYKPHGKTKKRQKAEKLAFQQSRLKEGDWVRRDAFLYNDASRGYSGKKFQIGKVSGHGTVNELGTSEWHSLEYLKPCKPPKVKPVTGFNPDDFLVLSGDGHWIHMPTAEKPKLESENFKIDDGRLIYKQGDRDIDCFAIGGMWCGEDGTNMPNGWTMSSSDHREIADLLDRSTASRK